MKWEKNNLIMESFPVGTLACNCCIIYEKETREALIIDPGNDSDLILKFVAQKKLKVKSLLHTHAHFDHIGGSSFLSTELNCPVHLHTDDFFLHKALPLQAMYFGEKIPEPKPVDHIIRDEETFGLNLSNLVNPQESKLIPFLKTLHTPGHTPGSCCFYSEYFDEPLLLSGDTLFRESVGRTDLPGGDSHSLIKSIKNRIFPLTAETQCIPGHGPMTSIYHEKKHNQFL